MRPRLALVVAVLAVGALFVTQLVRDRPAHAQGTGSKKTDVPPPATKEAVAGDAPADPAAADPAAAAAPAAEKTEGGPPVEVTVGVYLSQILSVNLKENTFTVSFWVWFRWKGDVKPLESFEVVGGRIESKEAQIEEELEGGIKYGAVRVLATITKFYDVKNFPLDNHTLSIVIEDADHEEHELKFVPDMANCAIDPGVGVPGWELDPIGAVVNRHTYKTNYGDITLPTGNGSTYSSFEFKVPLVRRGVSYFFKLFTGGYLATLIALLAFFIKPTDLDPRFGLGLGAVFAAMASAYVISSALPDTQIMTLADKVNALGVSWIFLSIVGSTISLKIFYTGNEAASKKMDRISFWALLISFAVLNILFVVTR